MLWTSASQCCPVLFPHPLTKKTTGVQEQRQRNEASGTVVNPRCGIKKNHQKMGAYF